jgi:ABC-type sugar transport system substrate-binding protein
MQGVTAEGAYILSNNQEEYAYLGAKWLFEQMGGEGDVVYMRGIAGTSADTDRDNGFKRALAEFPASRSCTRSSPAGSRTRASSRCSTSSPPASPSTASGRAGSTT